MKKVKKGIETINHQLESYIQSLESMKTTFFSNISILDESIKKKKKPKDLLKLQDVTKKMLTSDEIDIKIQLQSRLKN